MNESSHYTPTTKYIIKARFDVKGVVEKPDVIGAIFGQTEGLFGPDLDLRELQKTGRIGRIEIELASKNDRTTGTITVPSSLDKASTAIIAAAIESVDRIGPCSAQVILEKVEDLREEKRRAILDKAKDILKKWVLEVSPSTDEIVKEVADVLRAAELVYIGPEKLPAGPEVQDSGSIIVVEGRADVINLLRCDIKNVVGLEGTKIPKTIIDLSKEKEVTAFLDGDRGGELILKELLQVAELDYVARAPPGKEVEELTPKEILKCLRERIPVSEIKSEVKRRPTPEIPSSVFETAKNIKGTLEAVMFDEAGNEVRRVPVGELVDALKNMDNVHTLLFDGIITQRLLDLAWEKKIKNVIGDRLSEIAKIPVDIKIMTLADIL
ncbi:MAG: DNA primase DnaG [Candidatus Bathyarchaeia archaeon]